MDAQDDDGVMRLNLDDFFDTPEEIEDYLRRREVARRHGVQLLPWETFTTPEEAAQHQSRVKRILRQAEEA
jgi:hypothetical protein